MTPINTPHMTETPRKPMAEGRNLDAANLKELRYGG